MTTTAPLEAKRRPDEVDRSVGVRVRSLRKVRGITQSQLADALGLSFQQLQKYEKGQNRISVGMLVQIAEALHTEVGDLVEATPVKQPEVFNTEVEALSAAFLSIRDEKLRAVIIDLVTRMAATQ